MRRLILSLFIVCGTPLAASPPPPPPVWVMAAGDMLSKPRHGDDAKVAPLFADDVVASQNGVVVATGKAAWLEWRARKLGYQDHTLGISEGWGNDYKGGGELMVIDSFEDFDRSKLPRTFLVDARSITRATLYRFAVADHLIHFVDVSRVEGCLMSPQEEELPTAKPPA